MKNKAWNLQNIYLNEINQGMNSLWLLLLITFSYSFRYKKWYYIEISQGRQSEYFAGIIDNDCLENKEKKIEIKYFEPEVV